MTLVTPAAPLPTTQTINTLPDKAPPAPIAEQAVAADTDQLSPKFAQLARKEKQLRMQYSQMKTEEAAWKKSQDEQKAQYISKQQLKENPLALLQEAGHSTDELINLLLNGPKQVDPQLAQMQAEIQALKTQQEEATKKFEEKTTNDYQQAVNQIRNEAKLLTESDERFETIKETSSVEGVVALIEETFKETGIVMKVEEAAKQVEDYLVEEALKMARLKKVQSQLIPAAPTLPQKQSQARQQIPTQQTKTLTNAATSTSTGPLTNRQRIERAKLAFYGKLSQ